MEADDDDFRDMEDDAFYRLEDEDDLLVTLEEVLPIGRFTATLGIVTTVQLFCVANRIIQELLMTMQMNESPQDELKSYRLEG